MGVPVELEIFMRDLTKAGLQSVGKNVEGVESQTRRLIAALEQVRAGQLAQLDAARKAGQSYTTEAANVQALTGQINGLKAGLKELQKEQAAAGATKIDIDTGAVERKTNNLRMQFSQVARELPSLAMGPQMFILAISNNLPMLADAIADVRKQNELLSASGHKAVPVWRQLLGVCLSWQTALIAAISVGIMFGKDIANWVKGLFNGKKAFDGLKKAQEDYNKEMLAQQQQAQTEAVTLKLLYDAATDAAGGMKERTDAVRELKKEFPDYFKNLTDEEILTGKAADSYMRLTESIMASARAQAARNSIVEQQGKVLENEQKINEAYARLGEAQRKTSELRTYLDKQREEGASASSLLNTEVAITMAETAEKKIEKEIAGYRQVIYQANKVSKELEKGINVSDLVFDPKGTSGGTPTGSGNTPSGEKDYASRLAEARLRAERETERLRIQIQEEGFDRRRELARQEYRDTLADIERQRKETVAEMDKAKAEGSVIPQAQYDSVDEEADRMRVTAREKLNLQLQQIDREYNGQAAQDLIDYNRKYGTYAEKRLAIAQDYARKIAAAQTDGEKQALARQMKEALAELDFSQFRDTMNWEVIFGNLSDYTKKELETVRKQLETFRQSQEYRDAAPADKEAVDRALADIRSAIGEQGGLFGGLTSSIGEYRDALAGLEEAQRQYEEALRSNDEAVIESARKVLSAAQGKAVTARANVRDNAGRTADRLVRLSGVITQLGSDSEMSVSQLGGLVESVGGLFGKMGERIGGIVGAALSMLDQIGEHGLGGFIGNVTGSIGSALYGIYDTLLGWTGIDFGGESDPTLERDIERLTLSNRELEKAIDNLSEAMEGAAVADASQIYAVQRENLMKQMANTQEEMRRSAAASSDGFIGIGGHHATNTKINRGMSAADWAAISEAAGRTVNDAGIFFNLTSEEMWRVANEATTEYAKLKALADDGYKDAAQFMDEYTGYWKELEELEEEYREKLTSVSFDSVRDGFRSLLSDMGSESEDFAADFEKLMQSAVLESMMSSKYDTLLKEWYGDFAGAMEDGRMTQQEQRQLESLWDSISERALAERDAMKELFGWRTDTEASSGSGQSPTTGALTTMSQDSISRFEGIGRSLQTHAAGMDRTLQELRDQNRADGEALARIVQNTSHLLPIRELLERMERDGVKIQ